MVSEINRTHAHTASSFNAVSTLTLFPLDEENPSKEVQKFTSVNPPLCCLELFCGATTALLRVCNSVFIYTIPFLKNAAAPNKTTLAANSENANPTNKYTPETKQTAAQSSKIK
ncbi:hypothetical protein J709_0298 [Acinetobacter baumannii 7893]|nr:hypothetical protein ACINNAV2_2837 [Acinetobacter baumannii Naval-2]EXC78378.1 hypothetical protein J469_2969 [Acinetobacter baumannii 1046051]EXD21833.1 hypothetical protein J480_3698 [Acinetobacter baumannii 34654]EXD44644.1 hypothetical protein J476_1996 [Acinetobacter baumannii 532413]EXG71348.1 hypothetical protein J709_0298 [Acinetobacter baumannii 7893]EXH36412.1 hypothetical protein J629_3326 [Acinetobacter baumannii 1207552]EXS05231.1 hypothetical protein J698_0023 [Acinetobacter 